MNASRLAYLVECLAISLLLCSPFGQCSDAATTEETNAAPPNPPPAPPSPPPPPPPPPRPPNPTEANSCFAHVSCDECTNHATCVWCNDDEGYCEKGDLFGANDNCVDWRWKQCRIRTVVFDWILAFVLVLLVLGFLFVFCRHFCCQKKRGKAMSMKDAQENVELMEAERLSQLGGTRTPKTDKRRQEMRAKYGRSIRGYTTMPGRSEAPV